MFEELKGFIAKEAPVPGFGSGDAVADTSFLGGGIVYAHVDRFYFQMEFSGYAENKGEGVDQMVPFLELFADLTGTVGVTGIKRVPR